MDNRNVFLKGGGAAGLLMRTMSWEDSTLPDPADWTDTLKTATSISINSGFPIAIYWGKDFTLLYNDAYTPILGAKHPAAIGQPGNIVWEEIWDGLENEFQAVLSDGRSIHSPDTMFLMNRNGYIEECYFDYTLSPIISPEGAVAGVFNAVLETTARKLSERRNHIIDQLVLQQQHTQTFIQSLESCKIILENSKEDIPFFLIYIKAKNSGYRPVAVSGIEQSYETVEWPFQQFSGENGFIHIAKIEEYLPQPLTSACAEYCCEALIVPLKHDKAAISGFFVSGLSPRKRHDADYRKFTQHLGVLIGGILNNAFSWEEFLELEKEKDNLLGIISHELKTPITSIKAYAQLAARTSMKEAAPKTAGIITKLTEQTEKLSTLVKDLLDGTNLNLGNIVFDNEPFFFDELVLDIIKELQYTTDLHPIETNLQYARSFYGDRIRIAQVIKSLISNAIKFSPKDGVISIVSASDGNAVVFTIRDEGIGIPHTEHQKIFERFYRVVDPKLYTYPGIGLGLFIAKEIVRFIGGKLWVESQEGSGSTFHFSLPEQINPASFS